MFENRDVFLFDLDGTLLNIDLNRFLKYYFGALSEKFSNLCESREEFIDLLSVSTQKMVNNDGSKTNQEAFMDYFMNEIGVEDQEAALRIKERFDNFYQNEFKALAKYFDLEPELSASIIKKLAAKDKKLVLATNPLFPIEAVEVRLAWLGIDLDDFDLVTHYENMSYAKPNLEYYQQILDLIEEKPENCLMVGNDLQEDAVASELGIKTLIIEDNIIKRENSDFDIAWQGSLEEFDDLIKEID